MSTHENTYRIVKWALDQSGSLKKESPIFFGTLEEMELRFPKSRYFFKTIFFEDGSQIVFQFQVWYLLRWKTILDPRK